MNQHVVHKSIVINAMPSVVWDALTDPEKTKEYFFNCEVHSDWQPGSTITFKGKMFWVINIEMTGKITDIVPEKLLRYTLENKDSEDGSFSTVTDTLSYANGQTTLTISDDVGEGEGADKRYERSEKGWDKVLEGLKELVEKDA